MNKFKMKHRRYLAVLVAIILLFSAIGMIQGVSAYKKPKTFNTASERGSQNKETINEISNMTGVKSEEILKLKTNDNTWNDVLEKLKGGKFKDKKDGTLAKSNLLAEAGFDAEFIKKLRNEGFDNAQIIEAKALVERVTSQLNQILDFDRDAQSKELSGIDDKDAGNQDMEVFKGLAEKIDLKTAVYLILKLEKDFGSKEKVLDEYLLSLQVGLDINGYIKDKKEYEKEKSKKTAGFDMGKIVTMASIEAKVLDLLQNENKNKADTPQVEPDKKSDVNDILKEDNDKTPLSPLPDVQNPEPPNPQKDLMKEVEGLKNKSLNLN